MRDTGTDRGKNKDKERGQRKVQRTGDGDDGEEAEGEQFFISTICVNF